MPRTLLQIARSQAQPSEHLEQTTLMTRLLGPLVNVGEKRRERTGSTLTRRYPELTLLYAVPNGGLRMKATAGKLRAEGVLSAVPDMVLDVARGPFHGLRVELKRRGAYGGADQRAFAQRLREQGYAVFECQGHEEAYRVFESYLALEPADTLRWEGGGRNTLDALTAAREHYHLLWAPRPIKRLLPEAVE